MASPTAAHPLGTDGVGADVLSWLMAGSRTNLATASLTVVVAGIFGLALVAAMVSRHTALRSTSVVVVDALISIPTVLIALMLSVPVRRFRGGDRGRMRIRLRIESGTHRKTLRPYSPRVRSMWSRRYGPALRGRACSSGILCRT